MIPKIIHLCWFSGDKYPDDIQYCLDSWKKVLPDFQVKVWTKEMALATGIDFVKEAISVRMWAFAADVMRLYAVYHDGGVYMDSDIYVQKRFDEFLDQRCAFFQEYYPSIVRPDELDEYGHRLSSVKFVQGAGIQAALFMSEPGNTFIKDLLEDYTQKHFILKDGTFYKTLIAPSIYAIKAEQYGYKYLDVEQHLGKDIIIYPSLYVGSMIPERRNINFAIHCASHSWFYDYLKQKQRKEPRLIQVKVYIYDLCCKLVGRGKKFSPTLKEQLEAHSRCS